MNYYLSANRAVTYKYIHMVFNNRRTILNENTFFDLPNGLQKINK